MSGLQPSLRGQAENRKGDSVGEGESAGPSLEIQLLFLIPAT
jgi:hypothetical protein